MITNGYHYSYSYRLPRYQVTPVTIVMHNACVTDNTMVTNELLLFWEILRKMPTSYHVTS